jgi:hypothetical protein
MSKAALIVFIKGIFMLIIGIYLSSQGLPSDKTDATIYAGNQIIDSLNQTSNSPEVSQVASNTKDSLLILGIGATLIGVLEIIGSGYAFFKSL